MMWKILAVVAAVPVVLALVGLSIVVLMVSPPAVRWVALVVSSIALLWAMTKLSLRHRPVSENSLLGRIKSRKDGLL